jgi:hypothetical protein
MAQWILKANRNIVPRRTRCLLNTAELHSLTETKKRQIYDALIKGRWGKLTTAPPKESKEDTFKEYDDDLMKRHTSSQMLRTQCTPVGVS